MKTDIDDDFFTPSPSTSLANIFSSKNSDKIQNAENTTLKYVAPKLSDFKNHQESIQNSQIRNTDIVDKTSKSSECVFAHAVLAYELVNNMYAARGKLGLALLKLFTPHDIKLVLYDSNKKALSSVGVSATLEVKIQNNEYITYCDDTKKIWSLSCSNIEELNLITQTLRKWDVNITYRDKPVNRGQSTLEPIVKRNLVVPSKDSSDKESDTDSSINRNTKSSILNRMALVGQSVLPSPMVDKTSDSSDTDLHPHYRNSRHKPIKINNKKQHMQKRFADEITVSEPGYKNSADCKTSVIKTEDVQLGTDLKQLVSITNFSNDNSNHNTHIEHFISENRINNAELRININRVADKVDLILEKVKHSECKGEFCGSSDLTKNLFQKLLTEYENRIKDQNEKIKELETLLHHRTSATAEVKEMNIEDVTLNLKLKIESLQKENNNKTKEIINLKSEVENIKENLIKKNETIHKLENKCESLTNNLGQKNKEFELLQLEHSKVSEELHQLKVKFNETVHKPSDEQIHTQLKSIMNGTFRSLAANFDNDETYRGDIVKTIAGTVIKKTTMDVLNI